MSAALTALGVALAERGLVPEAMLRRAIREQCERHAAALEALDDPTAAYLDAARRGPVALAPEAANAQHYEVPAAFFAHVLGPRRKYSACHWGPGVRDLAAAEDAALRLTCEHARLADGQRILELGCGWGSLSLWMAAAFPRARVTAISNSVSQRRHIEAAARARGLANLEVRTLDMNQFRPADFTGAGPFDRVVSVEMFEHMRNWEELLRRVAACLAPEGRAFLHVFCHRRATYAYREDGPANWLGRLFFSGGMMPARDLLHRLDTPLAVESEWTWDGTHYQRTADAWAANLERRRAEVLPILAATYGPAEADRWFARWKMFFLACAEMFGLRGGREWMVQHTLLAPRR